MSGKVLLFLPLLALAHASAFMHPFLWDELPLPALPTPNSSRRFHLPALRLYSNESGVPWPTYRSLPVHSRLAQAEIRTQRVENILVDLCAVVLHADDCALLERQANGMGSVYIDTGFNMSRQPFMLRTGVREIMGKYSLPLRPLERKWNPVTGCAAPEKENK
jgi:hypothetical protein